MSEIQAILFEKRYWKISEAKKWLKEHKFKPLKYDITKNLYRFRLIDPKKFKKFRIKKFAFGLISFVFGFKK